ncbi:MAG: type II toxin-antitoxin system VapC family toxin [Bacteroidota bacterium]
MIYLLDTHSLLWYIQGNTQLSSTAIDHILEPQSEVHVSIVSLWEITIKTNIGKLQVKGDISQIKKDIDELSFSLIPISIPTLDTYQKLPLHHRDPFDRLLIAQTLTQNQPIISADAQFDAYDVERIW